MSAEEIAAYITAYAPTFAAGARRGRELGPLTQAQADRCAELLAQPEPQAA